VCPCATSVCSALLQTYSCELAVEVSSDRFACLGRRFPYIGGDGELEISLGPVLPYREHRNL
jgi:hypothetical protein